MSCQNQNPNLEPSYTILVMGQTGSGKSTVLNSLALGTHQESEKIFQEGDLYTSQTQNCQKKIISFKRRENAPIFKFIDIPGFMDSNKQDIQNIIHICKVIQEIGQGINMILFCFPLTRIRLSKDIQNSLKQLGIIFGQEVYKIVKICITQIDKLSENERQRALNKCEEKLIATIKELMEIEISNKMIVYKHGEQEDGLDVILEEIQKQEAYKFQINEIVSQIDQNNLEESIEKLEQNSSFQEIYNQIRKEREKKEEVERLFEEKKLQMQIQEENKQKNEQLSSEDRFIQQPLQTSSQEDVLFQNQNQNYLQKKNYSEKKNESQKPENEKSGRCLILQNLKQSIF